jgi:hypothetical protein
MKAGLRSAVVALALLPALSAVASAQTNRMHLGPQISYDFDYENFGIGAQFGAPLGRRLEFYPSFVWYFQDPGSLWNLNADLKFRVAGNQPHWLYVGAGLNITRFDAGTADDTDAGLNLLAGVESLKGMIHPFAEARLVVGSGSRFQLAAGLNFTLGSH